MATEPPQSWKLRTCRDHARWGGMVNELLTSHMFGENGLLRHCRRNASVTQGSAGDGRLFQLSGMDYQSICAGQDPLSVQAKVLSAAPTTHLFPISLVSPRLHHRHPASRQPVEACEGAQQPLHVLLSMVHGGHLC